MTTQTSTFSYSPTANRYRNQQTGRFVSEASVRDAVDDVVEAGTQRVVRLTQDLRAGDMTLKAWQREMVRELKVLHLETATVAHGGWARMSQADFGYVGSQLKTQYKYLRGFALAIENGTQPLTSAADVRASMYGQAARGTYEEMHRREFRNTGHDEERRVLHPAEHCSDCVDAADRGWQPLGSLPRIGDSRCLSRCHCTFEFRRSKQ